MSDSGLQGDAAFDSSLPERARLRAQQFWTPWEVATRAARLFRLQGAKTVLDVGCGPGKFCIAAARAEPKLHWEGVEQRIALVYTARRLARQQRVSNVRFSVADALDLSWDRFGGFYFFNPFAENVYSRKAHFDATVELSTLRFAYMLIHVEQRLVDARVGTVLVTYHGLGGPIPSSFDLIHSEPAASDRLRVWRKRQRRTEDWCWVDAGDEIYRAPRREIHEALIDLVP